MLSFFIHPATLIAGSVLVSTPIIIHLINRIRFRRVKWAAMEFLLKAQKKMRRKKILEQLLLLLMRCLLVFLVGALLARFLGCDEGAGKETRPTCHVVLIDDTPSMAEGFSLQGEGLKNDTTSFDEAKKIVHERLMKAAAEAQTPQTFHVMRLSDPDTTFPSGIKMVDGKPVAKDPADLRAEAKVSAESIAGMKNQLDQWKVSQVRRSLADGLRRARKLLDERAGANDTRVLHIVTDLRNIDWGSEGESVEALFKEFRDAGIQIHIIDVANPVRTESERHPQFGDNLSVVEIQPHNRVVAAEQYTDITVRIKNFGTSTQQNVLLEFFLNGVPDLIPTVQIPAIAPGEEVRQTVTAQFNRTGTPEEPLNRFNLVTVRIGGASRIGLTADDYRHTVVEVRPKLQLLIVNGRPELINNPSGDSFYLSKLVQDSFGNMVAKQIKPSDLDKEDLRPYSVVYLMNVPDLSKEAVERLERFVEDGGGVGVFLGPDVKPDRYNELLYRGGTGFFPVGLPSDYSRELTADERTARFLSMSAQVLLRSPAHREHPALQAIYLDERGSPNLDTERKFNKLLPFVRFERYWPITRGAWRDDKSVQELYCMPNEEKIADFEKDCRHLADLVRDRFGDPKFAEARKYLVPLLERVQTIPSQALPLPILARALDQLLCDQINDGDKSEPVLREFWASAEMTQVTDITLPNGTVERTSLRDLAVRLRDRAKYGPPLYIVKQFGKGRVAVLTTDAGGKYADNKIWNDWPSGASAGTWVIVVGEMQKYLSAGGLETNYVLADQFVGEFEPDRYQPIVTRFLITAGMTDKRDLTVRTEPLGTQPLTEPPIEQKQDVQPKDGPKKDGAGLPSRRVARVTFADSKEPGVYVFALKRKAAPGAEPKDNPAPPGPGGRPDLSGDLEFVAVPFNIDANREGNLRRATTDDINQRTEKAPLHTLQDTAWMNELKQKPTDYSSRRWIYLILMLLLIAEQAWAVRISYHTRPEDLELLAPSAAAAYAHAGPLVTEGEAATSETAA